MIVTVNLDILCIGNVLCMLIYLSFQFRVYFFELIFAELPHSRLTLYLWVYWEFMRVFKKSQYKRKELIEIYGKIP